MAIIRHAPGEPVLVTGRYALVGHYGEPTDYTLWREAGETFPLVLMSSNLGPFWFVRVDVADEGTRAA